MVELPHPSSDYDSKEPESEEEDGSGIDDLTVEDSREDVDEESVCGASSPDWTEAALRSQTQWQNSLSHCVVRQPRPFRDGTYLPLAMSLST